MAVGANTRVEPATPLGISERNIKGHSDMTTGNFGDGGNGVGIAGGIASALRQRLETEPRLPMPEQTRNQQLTRNSSDRKSFLLRDGLGRRIVVEDEDELPSRILDTSGSTFMPMTTTISPEPIHDEDEEENHYIEQDRRSRPSTNTGAGDRKSLRVSSPPVWRVLKGVKRLLK